MNLASSEDERGFDCFVCNHDQGSTSGQGVPCGSHLQWKRQPDSRKALFYLLLYYWLAMDLREVTGDCSQKIKRRLLLGKKVMTNLDSMLKSRDITLSTKVRLVKAMVFPVVMYVCETWTVKKAKH